MAGETSSRSATAVEVFSTRAGAGFNRTWKDFLYSLVVFILTFVLFGCSVEKFLFRALFQVMAQVKLFTVNDLDACSAVPLLEKDIDIYLREQNGENVRTKHSVCTGTAVCSIFCSSANVSLDYLVEQWNSIIIIIYFWLFFFFFFCV